MKKMMFIISIILFIIIILALNFVVGLVFIEFKERQSKIKRIEKNLIKRLSLYEKIALYISKRLANIIEKRNIIKLEKELLSFLNKLIQNIISGKSIYNFIEKSYYSAPKALKNILSILIMKQSESNYYTASKLAESSSPSIFLKLFFSILTSYRAGGKIKESIIKLRDILKNYIIVLEELNASLVQIKTEFIIGIVLPYFLLFIMYILYKDLMKATFDSPIGIGIILFSFILHLMGVFFFKKIIFFKYKNIIKNILFYNYLALMLKMGKTLQVVIEDASKINLIYLVKKENINILEKLKISQNKNLYDNSFIYLIEKSYKNGIPIADNILEFASDQLTEFKTRSLMFKNKAQIKALIPLLLFIFPATYGVILAPVIVSILEN